MNVIEGTNTFGTLRHRPMPLSKPRRVSAFCGCVGTYGCRPEEGLGQGLQRHLQRALVAGKIKGRRLDRRAG